MYEDGETFSRLTGPLLLSGNLSNETHWRSKIDSIVNKLKNTSSLEQIYEAGKEFNELNEIYFAFNATYQNYSNNSNGTNNNSSSGGNNTNSSIDSNMAHQANRTFFFYNGYTLASFSNTPKPFIDPSIFNTSFIYSQLSDIYSLLQRINDDSVHLFFRVRKKKVTIFSNSSFVY